MTKPISLLYAELLDVARDTVRRLDAHPIAGRLIAGTLRRDHYAAYLTQVAHHVRGSSPMLAHAGTRLAELGRHPALAGLFAVKSDEERGHDEWALDDLKALGASREAAVRIPACTAVAAYSSWSAHVAESTPIAVLGLAFVLEWLGYSRAGRAAENLVAKSGIPGVASAVSFLALHGEADIDHVQVLADALVDVMDPDDAEAVLLSARVTGELYVGLFDHIQRTTGAP